MARPNFYPHPLPFPKEGASHMGRGNSYLFLRGSCDSPAPHAELPPRGADRGAIPSPNACNCTQENLPAHRKKHKKAADLAPGSNTASPRGGGVTGDGSPTGKITYIDAPFPGEGRVGDEVKGWVPGAAKRKSHPTPDGHSKLLRSFPDPRKRKTEQRFTLLGIRCTQR